MSRWMRAKAEAKLFVFTDAWPPVMSAISCTDSVVFVENECATLIGVGAWCSALNSSPPVILAA